MEEKKQNLSTSILEASFPLFVSPVVPTLDSKSQNCIADAQRKSSREALYFWSKEQKRGLLWKTESEEKIPF